MPKVVKFVLRACGIILEFTLVLCLVTAFLIRTSFFQTFLAQQVAAFFSSEWKTALSIEKVDINLFDRVYLEGVNLQDQKKRNLLQVASLEVGIKEFSSDHLVLEEIVLNDGSVWVCAEKPDGRMNFDFISTYFASEDTSTSSSPFAVNVNNLRLNNTSLRYDDFRVTPSSFGFDPNHVNIEGLDLSVSKMVYDGSNVAFHLDRFKLKDRSGVEIKQLRAKFSMDSTGLNLSEVSLNLNRTQLRLAHIGYTFEKVEDRSDFLNKARVHCVILPSTLNLTDVSLLVPELKGMNENIGIEAEISNVPSALKIKNLALRVGNNTRIRANLELPDFNDWKARDFQEHLIAATIDMEELNAFRLPGGKTLNLSKALRSLGKVSLNNLRIRNHDGILNLNPFKINTDQGMLALTSPISLATKKEGITVQNLDESLGMLAFEDINLGVLGEMPDLGKVNGTLSLTSLTTAEQGMEIQGGIGNFASLEYNGYNYSNIELKSCEIAQKQAKIKLTIKDPNLTLALNGNINLQGKPNYTVDLNLQKANLKELGFANKTTSIQGDINAVSTGESMDLFSARVIMDQVIYAEEKKQMALSQAVLDVDHSLEKDRLKMRSNLVDVDFEGKIDPNTFVDDLLYSCSRPVPSWFNASKPQRKNISNTIDATLVLHDPKQITQVFLPELALASETKVVVKFNSALETLGLELTSNKIDYDGTLFSKVRLIQGVFKDSVISSLTMEELAITDSLRLYDLNFFTYGRNGMLKSSVGWDAGRLNESKIDWKTSILQDNTFDLLFDESRLSLNGYRWYLKKGSDFQVKANNYLVNNFKLVSESHNQEILLKGKLSDRQDDVLKILLTNLNLEDLSGMLGLGVDMTGTLMGEVGVANPFKDFTLTSNLTLQDFRLNQQEIGTLTLGANYDDDLASVVIKGGLLFRSKSTLSFNGIYNTKEKNNNIKVALNFDNTDLSFVNGLMDPSVVANVEGKLKGSVDVSGSLDEPILIGSVVLDNTAADFTMLGCRYFLQGRVNVDKGGFYTSKPLAMKDMEGNIAAVDFAVFHTNFTKFNYNVDIDFDHGFKATRNATRIDKFMVLNTNYTEGESYYGKAYARGFANISGHANTMEVTVDLTTRKGTKLIFPMYGNSELEDESIIHFVSKEKDSSIIPQKINYSGIDIKLGFNITQDADIRLVFNEQTQDEIRAKTTGKLDLSIDAFNQMKLNGSLDILPGSVYNFTMGPARKPFEILEGTLVWKGDVEHADMNVLTSYMVKHANMLELIPGQTNEALARQNTQCLLRLNGDLADPTISFKLNAPQAPEAGKVLINKINSDEDELSRQFFSLMLFNKYQPLQGGGGVSANESAALDLVESQINAALAQLSKNYEVKMEIGSSNISTSVQKTFLKDRLVVSGSFGVNNTSSSMSGGLVGDVSLEYLINEKGTFRVNAFNRSNGNTVKENSGAFTQGAGFSYHEDFNGRKDFVLLQTVLDIFRKKKNKVVQFTRKKQKTKVPSLSTEPIKQEEDENQ